MSVFQIRATNLQKKYKRQIIINAIDFSYSSPQKVAITGINGRGKSTLVKLISGYVTPSSGQIEYTFGGEKIEIENVFNHISIVAPYLDLIENMTAIEMLQFHLKHKPAVNQFQAIDLLDLAYLLEHQNKPISSFSSGMKQRLKLILALTGQSQVILLDEPVSNLDVTGRDWFKRMFLEFTPNKLVFIASNSVQEELALCESTINL